MLLVSLLVDFLNIYSVLVKKRQRISWERMSEKYDEVLTSILVNEKSVLGFLSAIFNFLARRTDFYYVSMGPHEDMGFPPGMAEELVIKVLRSCDPKNWKPLNGGRKPIDVNNEIMCSTVAQEVEVVTEDETADEGTIEEVEANVNHPPESSAASSNTVIKPDGIEVENKEYVPPPLPTQRNSETYNGSETEHYLWSQTIMDLDVIVKLPPDIQTAKELKVTINPNDLCVTCGNGEVFIKDKLPYKIKTDESFWSFTEKKLLIHLEKAQERWWNKLLESEEPIDLDRIDCSRPLYELPDDHVDKVRELQWNQERKMKGLPTSDQIRNIEILKRAWNAEGSPFKGQKFNPNVLQPQ